VEATTTGRRALRRGALLALISAAGLAAAACGGVATGPAASRAGTADVAYAGSLTYLNEKVVGPAFTKATGYGYTGRGAGSLALSQEIRAGEITPSVFESIGGAPIEALEPRFTSWYIQFAASPIVVAYNPGSRYAGELRAIADGTRPLADLFRLMASPGFRLGRTDPNLDPQGQAFVEMLMLAQRQYHLPAGIVSRILRGAAGSPDSPTIFDETALEPRLQAGQLDAASAYLSQAVQLHLPYISLPPSISLGDPGRAAHYATASFRLRDGTLARGRPLTVCITTIGRNGLAAAGSFVAYVLSPAGRALLRHGGYVLLKPTVYGPGGAVPAVIRHELGS
jgi:molybdate/tungstate transport system substrate-binding protein